MLIIFGQRAHTREGRLQVELAQIEYDLPRLARQWTHLSRQNGSMRQRGEGEKQLEVDRRLLRRQKTSSRKNWSTCVPIASSIVGIEKIQARLW